MLSFGSIALSRINYKVYSLIDEWRQRILETSYPYIYLDGIYLKQNFTSNFENVTILITMAVTN